MLLPRHSNTSLPIDPAVLLRLRIGHLEPCNVPEPAWNLTALSGRLIELSGSRANATLTFVFALLLDAQQRGENAAWICGPATIFFPPDVADRGVDLDALVVVRPPRPDDIPVAADWVLRSGAFGLVVLDLTELRRPDLSTAAQSRLSSLARKHATALLCLTEKTPEQRSMGSLVSLRGDALRRRRARDQFECALYVQKDKQQSALWRHVEVRRGTPGLR